MGLSNDLISQFVKVTNDKAETKKETTVYATTVVQDGVAYVKIDGSELLTPVTTTTDIQSGERVTVMIKDHSATITGNISSPSARTDDLKSVASDTSKHGSKITEFEIALGKKAEVDALKAETARIDSLVADNVSIKQNLATASADIGNLKANEATITNQLNANKANIESLQTTKLDVSVADVKYATVENLNATNANINNLEGTYADFEVATTNTFKAMSAEIAKLEAGGLTVEQLSTVFANIDFSNINKAAMEYFYSQSGLIDNVVIGDADITGSLVGVTIRGDLIEGDTIVADKLVILGDDGLYYKLNTDGITTEAEQTEYNSLNGQVILAKSITAEKINVNDLVAFDATIGGFNITNDSIFSDVKDDEGNTTRGIYMDKDGQINFGDQINYIKYFQDENGSYKLVISAESIMYALNGTQHSIADLGLLGEYVKIGTYEGEPCIELGERDNDFKLLITNTRILFMEGTSVPAHITNQSLHITKAVIEEELQQGEFVWKARSNGNLGLIWKGAI